MEMPLIISDADGRLIYKSRSVMRSGFLSAWKGAVSRFSRSGVVFANGKSYYVKELSLCGKKYFFFFDYEKISRHGMSDDGFVNRVLDFDGMAKNKCDITLRALADMFSREFLPSLYADGVRLSLSEFAQNLTVHVSPDAFVLAAALMVRLTSTHGRAVKLSFAEECGRVVVFCDACGKENVPLEAREVFEVMLYEVAASAGFTVERTVTGGRESFSLSLTPLDISQLGLKIPEESVTQRLCKCYLEMFL